MDASDICGYFWFRTASEHPTQVRLAEPYEILVNSGWSRLNIVDTHVGQYPFDQELHYVAGSSDTSKSHLVQEYESVDPPKMPDNLEMPALSNN